MDEIDSKLDLKSRVCQRRVTAFIKLGNEFIKQIEDTRKKVKKDGFLSVKVNVSKDSIEFYLKKA